MTAERDMRTGTETDAWATWRGGLDAEWGLLPVWHHGYGGGDLDGLMKGLEGLGIQELWDVRASNWSARPEFRGESLRVACAGVGIRYVWAKELGNPYRNNDWTWEMTAQELIGFYRVPCSTQERALCRLGATVGDGVRVCVLCACKSETRCHRHVVLHVLGDLMGLDVRPLVDVGGEGVKGGANGGVMKQLGLFGVSEL